MADIKLIVKISKNIYRRIKEDWHHESDAWDSYEAIRNGTPLTGTIIIDEDGDMHKVFKENKK